MRLKVLDQPPHRWSHRMRLHFLSWYVGMRPGPQILLTHRPDLFPSMIVSYIIRGSAGSRVWRRGETELFSAFVSKLNACHF